MSTTDRLDIAELFSRLSRLLDDGNPNAIDTVYTEDVVAHSPRGGELRGRDAVATYLRQAQVVTEQTVHVNGDILINLDGDRATASANQLVYFYRDGEPPHQKSALRLANTAVRTPAGWRFSETRITLAWTDPKQ